MYSQQNKSEYNASSGNSSRLTEFCGIVMQSEYSIARWTVWAVYIIYTYTWFGILSFLFCYEKWKLLYFKIKI